jgi:hypothetical protein
MLLGAVFFHSGENVCHEWRGYQGWLMSSKVEESNFKLHWIIDLKSRYTIDIPVLALKCFKYGRVNVLITRNVKLSLQKTMLPLSGPRLRCTVHDTVGSFSLLPDIPDVCVLFRRCQFCRQWYSVKTVEVVCALWLCGLTYMERVKCNTRVSLPFVGTVNKTRAGD